MNQTELRAGTTVARLVFVDGYNVIHADPRLARLAQSNLQFARDTLIAQLAADPRLQRDVVSVVFDGADPVGRRSRYLARGRIHVYFSPAGQKADDLIHELIWAANTDNVLIISNDRDVQWHAAAAGGSAYKVRHPANAPTGRSAPGRPLARPTQGHSANGGQRASSTGDDDDPQPTYGRKKGNANRAPNRRTREREARDYWW